MSDNQAVLSSIQSRRRLGTAVAIVMLLAGGFAGVLYERSNPRESARVAPSGVDSTAASPAAEARFVSVWVGDELPEFELKGLDGKSTFRYPQDRAADKFFVLNVHSPDCPCANNCARLIDEMVEAGYEDVQVVGLLSGADRIDTILERAREQLAGGEVRFPLYEDQGGKVSEQLGAQRTPTIWVVDRSGKVAFVGAPENTLFPGSPGHRYLLRESIDALRKGVAPDPAVFEPLGCPIKVTGFDDEG